MKAATRRQVVGIAGLFLVAGIASLVSSPGTILRSLEALTRRPLLFALALGGLYLLRPFLLWPVTSIAVLLGYLFGPGVGFVLALLGAGLTALPPYSLGRWANSDFGLFGYVSTTGNWYFTAVGNLRGVVAARLSPVPGDPISYTAGFAGVPLAPFVGGTVIGEIPWAIVAVYAGASMRTLAFAEFAITPEFLVALGGFALLILAGPLYRRLASPDSEDAIIQ